MRKLINYKIVNYKEDFKAGSNFTNLGAFPTDSTACIRSGACSALTGLNYRALFGRIVVPGNSALHIAFTSFRQNVVYRRPLYNFALCYFTAS